MANDVIRRHYAKFMIRGTVPISESYWLAVIGKLSAQFLCGVAVRRILILIELGPATMKMVDFHRRG